MENSILFLVVALSFIGLGLYFVLGRKGSHRENVRTVEATIVSHVTETDSSSVEGRGTVTTTSSFPVYEYQVDGQTYQTRGTVGITIFSRDKYKIGTKETIQVDQHNPRKIHTAAADSSTAVIGVAMIAMGVFTIVFVLL